MKKTLYLALLLLIISPYKIIGQFSGTWDAIGSLKKNSHSNKILLQSDADLQTLLKRQALLYDVYSVKIDNIKSPENILTLINQWDDISELYLKNSGTLLNESDFEQLKNIEHVIIEQEVVDSNLLEYIYKTPNLEKLTLIFKEEPQNWDFLYFYRNVKTLHIYGNFLPETLYDITDKLKLFNKLTELGLSIDYATDLPRNLNLLSELQILKLYDNLTRLNYDHQAQVQPERFNINGVLGNDKPTTFSIMFYSDDYGLTNKENKYIQSIWNGERDIFMPTNYALSGSSGSKKLYMLDPKPIFPANLNIETLLEELYPSAEVFTINAKNNVVIHTKSGCNLFIPAESLLKQDGSVYEGNAYVSIRYIDDLINSAFRGFDLRVGKYKNSPNYRSDVMLEIEISDGVFSLQFSEDVNIRLDVPVTDNNSALYFYDNDSKGFMDYELYKNALYSSNIVQNPIRYDEWTRNNSSDHIYMLDTRSFNKRFQNPETYFLFDYENKIERYYKVGKYFTHKEFVWEKKTNTNKNSIKIREGRNLLKIAKFSPKIKNKGDIFFQLDDKFELFNELSVFKRVLFKYSDTLVNKEFNATFTRNKSYSDFRIEKDREKNCWNIILKSIEGYKVIEIAPVFYKKNGKPYSEKKSNSILSKFYNAQKQREQSFENFNDIRNLAYFDYYNNRQNNWDKKELFKTVFIKSTGVYGFMNVETEEQEKVNCFINYLDNNGIPIDVKQLFVIDKTNQAVYKINKGNTSINLATVSLILCSDYKGQLHYIDGDALRTYGLTEGSIYFLRLNSLSHPPRRVEDFKSFIKYDKLK